MNTDIHTIEMKGEIRHSGATRGICMQAIGKALSNAGTVVYLVFIPNTVITIVSSTVDILNDIIEKTGNPIKGEKLKEFTVDIVRKDTIYAIRIINCFYGTYVNGDVLSDATELQYKTLQLFDKTTPALLCK